MRGFIFVLVVVTVLLGSMSAMAAEKVVVVPLNSSAAGIDVAQFVNVENPYTWTCPASPNSLAVNAECPANCVAVGGGCSAKTVGDATDVVVTGGNFGKTDQQATQYNLYQCWMLVNTCSNPSEPPVGYAQVVCFCN